MGRIIAIDYGTKRTGIAVTDPLQIIATALETVSTNRLIPFLESYFRKEKIDHLVMGFPKKMNGQNSEIVPFIIKLVSQLKIVFPTIPVAFVDERFTSRIAQQTMIDGQVKKKERRKKSNVDKISAVLILQSYLASSDYKTDKAQKNIF